MIFEEAVTFNDVLIVPRFSTIQSRKDVDLSFNGEGFPYMELPFISSNMDTVTTDTMARAMLKNGAQACLHRFQSIEDNVKMFQDSFVGGMDCVRQPMVSVGLGKLELERAESLLHSGAYCFLVDVANGASTSVVEQVKEMRKLLGNHISIVVGNFATGESIKTFLEYVKTGDIQGVKVGIGPGSICKTRLVTGCGYPQLSTILQISNTVKNTGVYVIADGGMSNSGDVSKALGAGAHMIMSGSLFSGTDETPGELADRYGNPIVVKNVNGVQMYETNINENKLLTNSVEKFKRYRGSASKESYEAQGKTAKHRAAEGESIVVAYKGPVKDVLQELEGGLRSAFTYVNARTLSEFHKNVEFVRVTSNTVVENQIRGNVK